VPFSQSEQLSHVLKELEGQLSEQVYIDIEMNSLEDAYLNIAKEEERLLEELHRRSRTSFKQVSDHSKNIERRRSIQHITLDETKEKLMNNKHDALDENNFAQYLNARKNPTLATQFCSNFKRRIIQFFANSQEMFLVLLPVINLLVTLVLVNTIFTAIGKMPDTGGDDWNKQKNHILAIMFPVLMQFNVIISGGLFIIAMFKDHFDGMRNLLKFAGMQSLSYKLGLILAEFCLFIFMSVFLICCGFILSQEVFGKHWIDYTLTLFAFGLPFVTMNNIFSYPLAWLLSGDPQKATEKGFMYAILPTLLLYGGFTAMYYFLPDNASWVNYLVPFNCLQAAYDTIMTEGEHESGSLLGEVYGYILAMLA
jgi:hypothetical protein